MNVFNRLARGPALGRAARVLSGVIFVVMTGCGQTNPLSGEKLYPVKGKVVLDDGKPLTTGSTIFVGISSNISVSAPIGSDGTFEFTGTTPGLPAGEYRVAIDIEGRQRTVAKGSKARPKENLPFPARYLDEDASKLTATVKADSSSNDFSFKLNK
jgi:hypothetical protein